MIPAQNALLGSKESPMVAPSNNAFLSLKEKADIVSSSDSTENKNSAPSPFR